MFAPPPVSTSPCQFRLPKKRHIPTFQSDPDPPKLGKKVDFESVLKADIWTRKKVMISLLHSYVITFENIIFGQVGCDWTAL